MNQQQQQQQHPNNDQGDYSSEGECCSDPECPYNIKRDSRYKITYRRLLKWYYVFIVFLVFLIGVDEELQNDKSWLNNTVRFKLDQPKLLEFLLGNVKNMGHILDDIFECPHNMTLREFHVELIVDYQPCIFRGQVANWSALEKWQDKDYLKKLGEKLTLPIQKRVRSNIFAKHDDKQKTAYMKYSDFIEKINGTANKTYYLYDDFMPKTFISDLSEPNVTQQLLKLEEMVLWHGYNSKSMARYDQADKMICVAVGQLEIIVVPSWERLFVYNGQGGIPENHSPIDFKSPDSRTYNDFQYAQKYNVKLNPGDCLYLPSFWWHQMETGKLETIAAMYYYEISSDWLRATFAGIERHLV